MSRSGTGPTTLLLGVRRYLCFGCGRLWRQDTTAAAPRRGKLFRGGLRRALAGIVVDILFVTRVAAGPCVAWHTANTAVLAEGRGC